VDSQKVGVGLLLAAEVQEVKADLLMKDRLGSDFKFWEELLLNCKDTPF